MASEIVWVYGNGGAGKATFITSIANGDHNDVIEKMGWHGKNIITCQESLDWVVRCEGDGNKERREKLLDVIIPLAQEPNSVILIKGQDLDFRAQRVLKLKSLLPEDLHKIIFINTDIAENYERVQNTKCWWKKDWPMSSLKKSMARQIITLNKLRSEFSIVTVDGGAHANYAMSEFPPTQERNFFTYFTRRKNINKRVVS